MSVSDELKRMSLELIKDPRVARLLQNEQVIRALVSLVQVPGRLNSFTAEQAERLARALHLPTPEERERLQRRVASLEEELHALKRRLDVDQGR